MLRQCGIFLLDEYGCFIAYFRAMLDDAHQKSGYFNLIEGQEASCFKAPSASGSGQALHNYFGWWWWNIHSTVGGFV